MSVDPWQSPAHSATGINANRSSLWPTVAMGTIVALLLAGLFLEQRSVRKFCEDHSIDVAAITRLAWGLHDQPVTMAMVYAVHAAALFVMIHLAMTGSARRRPANWLLAIFGLLLILVWQMAILLPVNSVLGR